MSGPFNRLLIALSRFIPLQLLFEIVLEKVPPAFSSSTVLATVTLLSGVAI